MSKLLIVEVTTGHKRERVTVPGRALHVFTYAPRSDRNMILIERELVR